MSHLTDHNLQPVFCIPFFHLNFVKFPLQIAYEYSASIVINVGYGSANSYYIFFVVDVMYEAASNIFMLGPWYKLKKQLQYFYCRTNFR